MRSASSKITESDFRRISPKEVLLEKKESKKILMMQYLAQQCRIDVFDVIHSKGTGHWGGASSSAELLVSLYFYIMNIKPDSPKWPDRDRLVLSKGHASCMLYSILANRGFFDLQEVHTFRDIDSNMQGHPSMNKTPGVDMSTGALGHGLSVGLGMSLAAKISDKKFWTFVITGEGCLDEGQTWEAMMAAAKFKPQRFILMVDYNAVQLDGKSKDIMPLEPLIDKLRAFNWKVSDKIYDGNSVSDICKSWQWINIQDDFPVAVIYKTVKGKGVSFMENDNKWHGAPIDNESFNIGRPQLIADLKKME
ncbi:MAG: transketolase, partial [Sedimentisphaerales bacterium]|nr:transketolase [Sedimentisphaerales bacterium]